MKKYLFVCLIILCSMSTMFGQLGIVGGLNFANLSITPSSVETNYTLAFHGGLNYTFYKGENMDFSSGILYSIKGLEFADVGGNIKYNYLEIPLIFTYDTGIVDINAGGYLAYALSGTVDFLGIKEDIVFGGDGAKRFDFGLNLGASYDIIESVTAGVRYSLGIMNVSAEDESQTAKHSVFSLYVMYNL